MSKIIKLTESQLKEVIQRVIQEQSSIDNPTGLVGIMKNLKNRKTITINQLHPILANSSKKSGSIISNPKNPKMFALMIDGQFYILKL